MKKGKLTLELMCAVSHACRQEVHAAIMELTVFHGESVTCGSLFDFEMIS